MSTLSPADLIKFSYAPRLLPEDKTTLVGHISYGFIYLKTFTCFRNLSAISLPMALTCCLPT